MLRYGVLLDYTQTEDLRHDRLSVVVCDLSCEYVPRAPSLHADEIFFRFDFYIRRTEWFCTPLYVRLCHHCLPSPPPFVIMLELPPPTVHGIVVGPSFAPFFTRTRVALLLRVPLCGFVYNSSHSTQRKTRMSKR